MLGLILCVLALVSVYVAGRKSMLLGLSATLLVGYMYGMLRANVPSSASHFIFDSAVAGLYLARLFASVPADRPRETTALRVWVIALCAWPIALLAIPNQETIIQLVGLRTGIFLLPFVLFGARLNSEEVYSLALWCAFLNILAVGVAGAEFFFGLERFLPRNAVTSLIYQQKDVANYQATRIPSTFNTASSYGGTMMVTFPLLLGAWMRSQRSVLWHRGLLLAAMIASGLGIFLAASRTATALMFVLLIVATMSGRVRLRYRVGWILGIALVAWLVSGEKRLQRFSSLADTEFVVNRLKGSANWNIVDIIAEFPLGNGLGGGGSNIPYFLQKELRNPIAVENEYARIALEQGIPGLVLWVLFVAWAFARRATYDTDPWQLGHRLAWWTGALCFGTAWIGLGLLAAIPMASILLLTTGWMIGNRRPKRVRLQAEHLMSDVNEPRAIEQLA